MLPPPLRPVLSTSSIPLGPPSPTSFPDELRASDLLPAGDPNRRFSMINKPHLVYPAERKKRAYVRVKNKKPPPDYGPVFTTSPMDLTLPPPPMRVPQYVLRQDRITKPKYPSQYHKKDVVPRPKTLEAKAKAILERQTIPPPPIPSRSLPPSPSPSPQPQPRVLQPLGNFVRFEYQVDPARVRPKKPAYRPSHADLLSFHESRLPTTPGAQPGRHVVHNQHPLYRSPGSVPPSNTSVAASVPTYTHSYLSAPRSGSGESQNVPSQSSQQQQSSQQPAAARATARRMSSSTSQSRGKSGFLGPANPATVKDG